MSITITITQAPEGLNYALKTSNASDLEILFGGALMAYPTNNDSSANLFIREAANEREVSFETKFKDMQAMEDKAKRQVAMLKNCVFDMDEE